jgi:hypothetical protein
MNSELKHVLEIREGDMIDVKADFDSNMLYYYNNDVLQGVIACTKNKLLEEQLYPCVNLSHGTELCLRNFDQPALDTTYRWKWATAPRYHFFIVLIHSTGVQ